MLKHTRRRALALLVAAGIGVHHLSLRALAQDETDDLDDADEADDTGEPEEPECYDSKKFGDWIAEASDSNAGARLREAPVLNPDACDLEVEFQINTKFESKIFVTGSEDGTQLPEEFLVKPENRLLAKTAEGTVVVDEPLCGNCTDIYDDAVSIVLPLATAPLFREQDEVELAIRLAGKDEDCRFKIDCATMREALDWATERRDALAEEKTQDECVSPEGCFITTACCEVLGLDDDCFELRTLRRYRDGVLAKEPGGAAAIARYYALAPHTLAQLRQNAHSPERTLLSIYARYVLPAALAARLGLNRLAYRLYTRMLNELADADVTSGARPKAPRPLT